MPEIHIHRDHQLGLARARELASEWVEQAQQKFAMECTVTEGEGGDVVEFTRGGVKGELRVAADEFDLTARLGLMLGAFSKAIQGEIEKNLDALLAEGKRS